MPQDIPADRTLLLIGYEREHQSDLDAWTRGLGLHPDNTSPTGPLAWLELPVIDRSNAFLRMIIKRGMRSGIPNHAVWAHVITLYTDKAAFNAAAGIPSTSRPIAMVIDRTGTVLEQVAGQYTVEGANRLLSALRR